ncbi:MAG TPA: hypothetical protein VH371_07525 [Candidatus Limnocylindrales bacterium]|jgi:hypothetical protein
MRRDSINAFNPIEEMIRMGDKGPGSKGGGKKPKTSTKKKGAAAPRPS